MGDQLNGEDRFLIALQDTTMSSSTGGIGLLVEYNGSAWEGTSVISGFQKPLAGMIVADREYLYGGEPSVVMGQASSGVRRHRDGSGVFTDTDHFLSLNTNRPAQAYKGVSNGNPAIWGIGILNRAIYKAEYTGPANSTDYLTNGNWSNVLVLGGSSGSTYSVGDAGSTIQISGTTYGMCWIGYDGTIGATTGTRVMFAVLDSGAATVVFVQENASGMLEVIDLLGSGGSYAISGAENASACTFSPANDTLYVQWDKTTAPQAHGLIALDLSGPSITESDTLMTRSSAALLMLESSIF